MSGVAQDGLAISSESNLAIAGVQPSGIAAQGQVVWSRETAQFLGSTSAYATANPATTITTPAIDTTGANLLVVMSVNVANIPSDNQGNTWSLFGGSNPIIYYCINPATSTNHTFSLYGQYQSLMVLAYRFSGSFLIADQINGTSQSVITTSISPGPITPSTANSLIICAADNSPGAILSVDSSMNIKLNVARNPFAFASAAASVAMGTPTSINPIWSLATAQFPSNPGAGSTICSFIPSPWQIINGLVDFWPMNEGAGSTFNNVVNPSNPMTAQNITWAQSFTGLGPTPQFNAATGSGAVSAQPNTINNPFSACVAVIFTSMAATGSILLRTLAPPTASSSRGWQLLGVVGNNLQAYIINSLSPAVYMYIWLQGGLVTLNQPHYLVFTYDGSGLQAGMNIYLDGVLRVATLGQNTFSDTFLSNMPVLVGKDETSSNLNGTLANVRIYNRVLTQAEITALSATMGR